jgi:thiol-disulfide isomerase/thioredoxin
MREERLGMKLSMVFAGVLLVGGAAALAMAQTAAPKDPALIDIQGYQKVLEKYKGQPLLVTMWATWCEPCRDEYPMVNELAKQYAPQGLKVVGISMDQDGDLILMRRFLAKYKPVFPNYRKKKGDEDAFTQAVMPGWNGSLPATFFYGRDGRQVGHLLGAGTPESFEAEIRAVVAK